MLSGEILTLLRQGGGAHVSGEEMSRVLGVSRAAVWKGIEALRRDGCVIDSAPRRGYRLRSGPSRVTAAELRSRLAGRCLGGAISCLDTVDSTNSEAKRRAADGANQGLVVIAEEQTAGRGRRGNYFLSLGGKGLYFSVLLRPTAALEELSSLTARAAVAVCRGIEAATGAKPGIKWTNDLILNGKKLCGILTELELEAESGTLGCVILGVGINVSQSAEDFGPTLGETATSLEAEGFPVSRVELACTVLEALDEMYRVFPGEGEDYFNAYRTRCVTLGREVLLHRPGGTVRAFAEDLTPDFGLVVRRPGADREILTAGEVSVRGLMGYI